MRTEYVCEETYLGVGSVQYTKYKLCKETDMGWAMAKRVRGLREHMLPQEAQPILNKSQPSPSIF